jgi:predicted nucleotidyltransferase
VGKVKGEMIDFLKRDVDLVSKCNIKLNEMRWNCLRRPNVTPIRNQNITSQNIINLLKFHKDALIKYGVKRIGLFGSYVRGDQRKNSDIDFLVEFDKPVFENFMDLAFYLENLFGRKVELITNGNLSPYIQPYVEKEVKWYETESAIS